MILFSNSLPTTGADLISLYQRTPLEGMVQSTLMHGERYEMADAYQEDWACSAVTWSLGGEETYRFHDGRTISIEPAGALTISAETRYAYAAGQKPFYSNMIVFPHWITRNAMLTSEGEINPGAQILQTRLIQPAPEVFALMNAIAAHCRNGVAEHRWYSERLAVLYGHLLDQQTQTANAHDDIASAKSSTRAELARRIDRAQQYILEAYNNSALDLNALACEACLSPYHFIRIFKACTNKTPIEYLTSVRMETAHRLLEESKTTVSNIAVQVGYKNRAAFFKAFRRYHGAAPSSVRKS